MKTEIRKATDDRTLVVVVCDKWAGEASAPTIETVFHLDLPEVPFNGLPILVQLSCTRLDTREHITPDPDQEIAIRAAAGERARKHVDADWDG